MAVITDPVALAFVDQQVRVRAKLTRALKAEIDDLEDEWFNGANAFFSTGSDTVENRVQDGRPVTTAQQVTDTVVALLAARDTVTAARSALYALFSDRPIDVT